MIFTRRCNFIITPMWISKGYIFIQIILQLISSPPFDVQHQRSMNFIELYLTRVMKFTLWKVDTWHDSGFWTTEEILNHGAHPAVTHYLIISHLLVAKEKIEHHVLSLKYTSVPFEFLHILLCCKFNEISRLRATQSTISEWEGNSTNLLMHTNEIV